jgi:hypothetical protein
MRQRGVVMIQLLSQNNSPPLDHSMYTCVIKQRYIYIIAKNNFQTDGYEILQYFGKNIRQKNEVKEILITFDIIEMS